MLNINSILLDQSSYTNPSSQGDGFIYYDSTQSSIMFNTDSTSISLAFDHKRLLNSISTGVLAGGLISANGDPTKIDIAAGVGQIVNNYTDTTNPTLTFVSWPDKTAIV